MKCKYKNWKSRKGTLIMEKEVRVGELYSLWLDHEGIPSDVVYLRTFDGCRYSTDPTHIQYRNDFLIRSKDMVVIR